METTDKKKGVGYAELFRRSWVTVFTDQTGDVGRYDTIPPGTKAVWEDIKTFWDLKLIARQQGSCHLHRPIWKVRRSVSIHRDWRTVRINCDGGTGTVQCGYICACWNMWRNWSRMSRAVILSLPSSPHGRNQPGICTEWYPAVADLGRWQMHLLRQQRNWGLLIIPRN